MRVFRTTWWGQTSDVWLLSSHSWDGDSYTPCSLTQQLCEHAPTLTPVFLAHLHSSSVGTPLHSHLCSLLTCTAALWARPYTHTHTHTHTPLHTHTHTLVFHVCQAGAYRSVCVKTEQAWISQAIDSGCKLRSLFF